MTFIRFLGLLLGVVFIALYLYTFYTELYGVLGSLVGMSIGLLLVVYGLKGTDLLEILFKKLTGRSFSNGS
jgi:hypothetical protein